MTKFFQSFSLLAWTLLSSSLIAADTETVKLPPGFDPREKQLPADSSRFTSEFLYMLFVLGCVIGVLLFLSWFVKRMMQTKVQQMNETSQIKISETRALGPKSLLHLIEVNGTTILISETPAGVTPLLKFKDDRTFEQLLDKKPES